MSLPEETFTELLDRLITVQKRKSSKKDQDFYDFLAKAILEDRKAGSLSE